MATIRDLRLRAGKPQKRLAYELGVSRQTLWRWENGFAGVPAGEVMPLADGLGVEPGTVLKACHDRRDKD